MSKSLLFYNQIVPINKARHANWRVASTSHFDFAREANSVPLTAVEFPSASAEFAIVFTKHDDGVLPIAILGVRPQENLFVDADGGWRARYVPAFIRRYPFVFSTGDDGQTLTLCVDEDYEHFNEGGDGERLFNEQGENTEYLNKVVDFLKEFQNHHQRTSLFGKKLDELGLLEPMGAQFKTPAGEERSLNGFFVVNRDKLKQVEPEALAQLAKTDELELVYLHLNSLKNLNDMIARIPGAAH